MSTETAYTLMGAIGGIIFVGVAAVLGALIDTWRIRRRMTKTNNQLDELQ